jgi:predicted transcriptional regulator of viral defense system
MLRWEEKTHNAIFLPSAMPGRVYTQLLEAAQEQHGYVTSQDERGLGVDPLRLQDLARRGLADHVSHGVYRISLVPAGPLDQYMEATLWPRSVHGVLCGATALDLHRLCDVNPARIHLSVPARYRPRREVPALYVLHRRDLAETFVTSHEGIAIVTPYRAILDGIEEHLPVRLIEQAISSASNRGFLCASEHTDLRDRLGAAAVEI